MLRRAALPPTGIVIVLGDLVETELLIVIGTDPFGSVDRAFFQGWIGITARDLLRNAAELGQSLASPSANPHLQALEVGDGVDLLAKPTAHLGAGIAAGYGIEFGFPAKFIEHVLAAVILK